MPADKVVLYVAGDKIRVINSKLSNDIKTTGDWKNGNKGKTETFC